MPGADTVKRVALVSPYDWATNGGVNEHIRHLAAHLERRNIEATILAPYSATEGLPPNVVSLGPPTPIRVNGSVARPTLSPFVIERVHQLLVRQPADVLHLHEPLVPFLPASMLNASIAPNVGTFHASGERSLAYASGRHLARWLAQRLTLRIAVSPTAAAFIRQYVPGDYLIIPNGVDTVQFHPAVLPMPAWADEGQLNVLFVGRFDEPRKGLGVLLAAWPDVVAACPAARLLIVGRGDVAALRARIAAEGVPRVVVIGPIAGAELPRWYRSAAVFCAPSTGQESFGIILAEAMSSGTPVVASDIAGYRDVVQHRREGLLVPPQQPVALANALIYLLGNADVRAMCGVAGRATAQHYAWDDVTERVIEVYGRAAWTHRRQGEAAPTWVSASSVAVTPARHDQENARTIPGRVGEEGMFTPSFEARVRAWTQRIVGRLLGRSGISPNVLTALGLLLTVLVTIMLARGSLRWGGVLVLLTSAFDMLDGALARATNQKSTFGAFLDSTFDRYAEGLIFLGLLLYYQGQVGAGWATSLVYLTILGSLMVSYTRAKAEALGYDCKVGMLGRPERILLLAFGLLVGWLPFALAILALFTNLTAAQRVFHVWQQDRKRNPRPVLPKAPRRGWFLPRD